jgi:hypothetical protein
MVNSFAIAIAIAIARQGAMDSSQEKGAAAVGRAPQRRPSKSGSSFDA